MVRTKQTGKLKSNDKLKANGTPRASPVTLVTKSPTQPAELSDSDKTKIKNWLDKQDKPFTLATTAKSKKRKRSPTMSEQVDLFELRLNVQYEVRPKDKWESLRRYKKFTGSHSRRLD